jgi:hypothetical protein
MKIFMGEPLSYRSKVHVGAHNYAKLFTADGHDVFWLGGSLHPLNVVRAALGSEHDRQIITPWQQGGERISERLITYQPLTLLPYRSFSVLGSRFVLEHTLDFTLPSVRSIAKKFGFDPVDVLWVAQSFNSLPLLKLVQHRKFFYRIIDSFSEFKGVPASMREVERELIARADAVFVTARRLYENTAAQAGDKVIYMPNGVDYPHFSRPRSTEPVDLAAIPHPRILYIGAISYWYDFDLLEAAARGLPDYHFVLVGPAHVDLQQLKAFSNIHVLGARPYAQIPDYMQHCDVGIMPFVKNALTDTISPIKFFEYFAAGLPVVAVSLHEIEGLASPAALTRTTDEFIDALKAAVAGGRDLPAFASFAQANSWEHRYQQIKARWLA